jgi:hypothetical protein
MNIDGQKGKWIHMVTTLQLVKLVLFKWGTSINLNGFAYAPATG